MDSVYVKKWHKGRDYYYHIIGKQEDCINYYERNILSYYPFNPYFTMIEKKGKNYIFVRHADSSD